MIQIDLTGKVAVVTGASQGLGETTARLLHRAGATVVVNYVEMGTNQANAQASSRNSASAPWPSRPMSARRSASRRCSTRRSARSAGWTSS